MRFDPCPFMDPCMKGKVEPRNCTYEIQIERAMLQECSHCSALSVFPCTAKYSMCPIHSKLPTSITNLNPK
jgi:hypothetical protein